VAEDRAKVEEKLKALWAWEEYTEKLLEKEKRATVKSFAQIFEEDQKAIVTYVPELDCNVTFKPLTVADQIEISQIKDEIKAGDEILFRMWSRGDPTVTREKFEKLSDWKKSAILAAMMRKIPFLPKSVPPDLYDLTLTLLQSKPSSGSDLNTGSVISSKCPSRNTSSSSRESGNSSDSSGRSK